ncbi:Putative Endo-1,4-beta-glucanase [Penicillium brasilianum]|uniref:AA9 family lytic polysaccharide monooxygenase n=1 Tax=Penicillium brasilianum TaxID=104259 RepID=A0A0F7TYC6_PENBI|nr:Putative Endo-1,4-beta-glucanase [Penicillium brasilianum]
MLKVVAPALLATLVAGHGHITNIVINGVSYEGWDINSFPYETDPPTVVAWGTPNTANGFITPDNYGTSDIICHLNATNAKGHAVVAAGDKINLQWTTWPDTHHGPVIDYLANCGDSCETVDKTTLKFFKIDGVGLVDDTTVPGTWGDDQLIANNNSWLVEIPPTLAPGNYVLRHELIALHSAGTEDGAQNYPQCFNLQVTGSGTDQPSGVLGTELYSSTDAGIIVNIYTSLSTYVVPGPTLYSGAVSITQSSSSITAPGTPVTGSGSVATTSAGTGGSTTAGQTTSSTTSTTARTTSTTSADTTSSTTLTTRVSTSSTTLITSTTSKTSTTSFSGGSTQSVYGQCGGSGWSGATACNTQATCSSMNPYYFQCVPTAA